MPSRTHRQLIVLGALFLFPVFSHAQVVINEVMYNSPSTDNDWIEMYNTGSEPVTIVAGSSSNAWRIVDSTNHTLTSISGGMILTSNAYAVIVTDAAKFISDWPGFVGPLFQSSAFSLTNAGGHVGIKSSSSGTEIDFHDYTSQFASGDGNSLQKQSDGTWIAATPTPGSVNSSTPISPPSNSSDSSASSTNTTTPISSSNTGIGYTTSIIESASTHYSYLPLSDFQAQQNLSVSAGRNRLSAVGNPLQFQAEANIPDDTVKYNWSFGDGTTQSGKLIKHIYEYSGTYAIVLNAVLPDSSAISRTTVTVVDPKLDVLEGNSQYIKIKNSASKEINLYGWEILSEGRSFAFPTDTIILADQSVYFPANVTSLSPLGRNDVQILPVSESPMTIATHAVVPPSQDTAILQKKRAELYQELIGLEQEANVLATENHPKPIASIVSVQTSTSTKSTEVAAPIEAVVSGDWLSTLKKFFLGVQ